MTVDGWKRFFDIASVALVLATFIAGAGVLSTGNIINKRQEKQLREFDKRLTDSKTELGKQQERAAKAERELKETTNIAGTANQKAGEANERAANVEEANLKLQNDVAEQQERAAIAEKELLIAHAELATESIQIQRIMRPRSIPMNLSVGEPKLDAEIAAKYAALKDFAGMPVVIFATSDSETRTFANDLNHVLADANWASEIRELENSRIPGIAVYSGHWPPGGPEPNTREWRAGVAVAQLINMAFGAMEIGPSWPPPVKHYHEDLLSHVGISTSPKGIVTVRVGTRDINGELIWLQMRRHIKEEAKKNEAKKQK